MRESVSGNSAVLFKILELRRTTMTYAPTDVSNEFSVGDLVLVATDTPIIQELIQSERTTARRGEIAARKYRVVGVGPKCIAINIPSRNKNVNILKSQALRVQGQC